MKIPAPLEEHFFASLLNATYWCDDAFQINLEARGFDRTSRMESFVLINIAAGEQRAIDIARNLGVSRQTISLILKEFEARGWVTTTEDPTDRRARIVSFSSAFEKRAKLCSQIVRGIVRELERRLGKPMVDTLRATLAADWGKPPQLDRNGQSATPRPRQRGNGVSTRE